MAITIDYDSLHGMSKAALYQLQASLNAEVNDETLSATKGELTPDQLAELERKVEYGEAIKARIDEYPEIPNLTNRVTTLKTAAREARKPATPPPPSAGYSAGGDGAALKGHLGSGNGSPFGIHGSSVKSLGDAWAEAMGAAKSTGHRLPGPDNQGNWGVELKGFDRLLGHVRDDGIADPVAIKATLDLTTAPLARQDDIPGVVDILRQRLTVADLLGRYNTNRPTIRYIRQTSHTNAATSVAMGGTKPEAGWALSQVTVDVTKIAVTAKVADEMFEDYDELRGFVDGTLRFDVLEREEALIINGDGNAPNMRGILQTVGIQTETSASVADNMDAVMRAITKIQAVGRMEPDGIVIHPTDYRNFRLTRDGNEQYYGGGPFTGAYGNTPLPSNPGLWAQRTVVTTAISAGTVLVGNFQRGGAFARRSGVMVQATNTNEDDFVNNLMTIRAEERGVVLVYRPLAFAAVTLAS
jgi:HK97 family phage major capsid protein